MPGWTEFHAVIGGVTAGLPALFPQMSSASSGSATLSVVAIWAMEASISQSARTNSAENVGRLRHRRLAGWGAKSVWAGLPGNGAENADDHQFDQCAHPDRDVFSE